MKSSIQYTIRNIPEPVDRAIKKRAKRTGKSFNATVVELLSLQTFGTTAPDANSLQWFVGAGKGLIDEDFDNAIAEQSKIDETLWRM
jgi:plasmid stability protein